MTVEVSLIAAVDRTRLIGEEGELPWHLPRDLKRFKEITMRKPILMGRKTHESIGKPLPGRENIVLTRNENFEAEGCRVVHTPEDALQMTGISGEEVMVIGGASVYAAFIDRADRMYLTVIHHVFEGDTYFPAFDPSPWVITSIDDHSPDDENPYPYSFYVLNRASSGSTESIKIETGYDIPQFLT